jgi:ketopantoate hydroxymethyltransferase
MAFADPQSVTINAVANSLPRTSSGVNSGGFSTSDGITKLLVSHSYGKRIRRTARIDYAKIAADTYNPTLNVRSTMSAYVVVDVPPTGFTVAEQKYIVDALTLWLTAASAIKTTQLLGGEV